MKLICNTGTLTAGLDQPEKLALMPLHSPSLHAQQIGRITRVGTFEFESGAQAFQSADRAVHAGHPVKLGKEPGKPWTVTVEPKA